MNENEVLVLSGMPGAGKSTYSKKLKEKALANDTNFQVFSADLFFMRDGEYKFDASRRGEAHAWCFREYCNFLRKAQEENLKNVQVVVDNTNLSAWEISPYVQAANAWGFNHKIVTIKASPDVAFKRQLHSVPLRNYMSMYVNFVTRQLPPFWNTESV